MTDRQIENAVRDLHARIWRARDTLWAAGEMPAPVGMLDPAVAARLLNIEFEVHDELGSRFCNSGSTGRRKRSRSRGAFRRRRSVSPLHTRSATGCCIRAT